MGDKDAESSGAGPYAPPKQEQTRDGPRLLNPSELSFDTVCQLFEKVSKVGKTRMKNQPRERMKRLKRFIDINIVRESRDAYSVYRLTLPHVREMMGHSCCAIFVPDRELLGSDLCHSLPVAWHAPHVPLARFHRSLPTNALPPSLARLYYT